MLLNLRDIALALNGEVSGGQVRAAAPGHSPADRGMSIKVDADAPGGFLVKLFNGGDEIAAKDYVRERLGLPPWQPNGKGNSHHSPGRVITRPMAERRAPASPAPAPPAPSPPETPQRIVATYDYVSAENQLLYRVVRLEPGSDGRKKDFRQRRADGKGGWIGNLGGVRRVLYRLRELLAFPDATTWLCEGEKDADRLISLGFTATTISGGAKWSPELAAPLAGRDVVIMVDNDDARRKKAQKAATALQGVAATVRFAACPTCRQVTMCPTSSTPATRRKIWNGNSRGAAMDAAIRTR